MRSRDELAEEIALAMAPTQDRARHDWALILSSDAIALAETMIARRAPLGDQPAAYVPRVGDFVTIIDVDHATAAHEWIGCVGKIIDEIGASQFLPLHSNEINWANPSNARWIGVTPFKFRPATPSERVSAGLAQPAASETPAVKFSVGRSGVKADPFSHAQFEIDRPWHTGNIVVYDSHNTKDGEALRDRILALLNDAPPASPARSERPTTPAPRDEAEERAKAWIEWRDNKANDKFVKSGDWNPYVEGWLACARARDGGR